MKESLLQILGRESLHPAKVNFPPTDKSFELIEKRGERRGVTVEKGKGEGEKKKQPSPKQNLIMPQSALLSLK